MTTGPLGALLLLAGIAGMTAFAVASEAQLIAPPELGDARDGARVFAQCGGCHSLAPGKNMTGPSLYRLFGRKAGSAPGYRYSRALRRSGVVWSEDTLSLYLVDPRRFAPDDKRAARCRIDDPTRLGDLLAYLESASR